VTGQTTQQPYYKMIFLPDETIGRRSSQSTTCLM
jgi:hypothetical protein